MRRLLVLLLVAACLLPEAGPVRAQATADQLNKLSLEALTTPAPGGNPGSYRRSAHRSSYRGLGRGYRSYARHSYTRRRGGYRAVRRSYARGYSTPARGYSMRRSYHVRRDSGRRSLRRSSHGYPHATTHHHHRRHRR